MFVAMAPPIWFAQSKLNLPWRALGKFMIGLSIVVLIGFAIYDYQSINEVYYRAGYVWQRYLLSVASLVNVPIVQTILIGFGLVLFGKRHNTEATVKPDVPENEVVPIGSE